MRPKISLHEELLAVAHSFMANASTKNMIESVLASTETK